MLKTSQAGDKVIVRIGEYRVLPGHRSMLDLGTLTLRGDDLLLRPLVTEDAEALALVAAEGRDSFGFTPVPNGLDETVTYVRDALAGKATGMRFPFAIEFRGRVVGTTSYYDYQPWRWPKDCTLQREDRPDALEIGYTWLASSEQRTSCNTRCKLALLQHAFERYRVHRVALRTDARNARSRRAIERLGAQLDGVLRGHTSATDCSVRNSAYYSILAAEWPVVKSRLLGYLARG